MIKKKSEMRKGPIEIDLTGPEGNAFVLLGYAKRFADQIWNETLEEREERLKDNAVRKMMGLPGMDGDMMTKKILDEMRESDYENLVNVFDKYFGSFVILYRQDYGVKFKTMAEFTKEMLDWMKDGNAVRVSNDRYLEQTSQWKRIFTKHELIKFFNREFKNQ